MRFVRGIGHFLIRMTTLLVFAGILFFYAKQFFYPGSAYDWKTKTEWQQSKDKPEENDDYEEQTIEAAMLPEPVITADTVFLVEKINLTNGDKVESREVVPVQYLGMNRNAFVNAIEGYDRNPPLSELENGFSTIEVSSFSKDRVSICKYYKDKEPVCYYLMVRDHFIVVYEQDKKTIYMNTDIRMDLLSYELQKEIMYGKCIDDEEALYNFLESYSS